MIHPTRNVFRWGAVVSVALTLILALIGYITATSVTYLTMATMVLFMLFALLQGIFSEQVRSTSRKGERMDHA